MSIADNNEIFDRIRQEIGGNDIVLYMKGSAAFPQCGYSAAVVQVLRNLNVPFRDTPGAVIFTLTAHVPASQLAPRGTMSSKLMQILFVLSIGKPIDAPPGVPPIVA